MRGEEIVREGGGVPATIGVVHGQSVVGLSPEEINELAYDDDVTKASVRDLAYTAVSKKNAGTTIASTSHLARAAGIDVFATGGLGGVHHGASETFDESADIYSLARTPIVMPRANSSVLRAASCSGRGSLRASRLARSRKPRNGRLETIRAR